jgi:hypothetical protein
MSNFYDLEKDYATCKETRSPSYLASEQRKGMEMRSDRSGLVTRIFVGGLLSLHVECIRSSREFFTTS